LQPEPAVGDAGHPWWERSVAFNPYHVKSGEHGGQFTTKEGGDGGEDEDEDEEKGPPVEKRISPRQVKADEAWKRAQDLRPVEHEPAAPGQKGLPGIAEDVEDEEEPEPGAASDEDQLAKWEAYDEAVIEANRELGQGDWERHPEESEEEHAERVLRGEWRDRNDQRPEYDWGDPQEWEQDDYSDEGGSYYNREALDEWKAYDESFDDMNQAEGESDEDYAARERRGEYREANESMDEWVAEQEQKREEKAERKREEKEELERLEREEYEEQPPVEWSEGTSQITASATEKGRQILEARGLSERQAVELTGLQALEKYGEVEIRSTINGHDGNLHITSKITGTGADGRTWSGQQTRVIKEGELYNSSFFLDPHAPDGTGLEVFAAQVEAARENGEFGKIHVYAARQDSDDPKERMVGYYTWPRFGYDGDFSASSAMERAIQREPIEWQRDMGFIDASGRWTTSGVSMSKLMSTKTGRDLWREHGDSIELDFDLDEDSVSSTVLANYLKERGYTVKVAASRSGVRFVAAREGVEPKSIEQAEEIRTTPEEDAAIDAVWDSPEVQTLVRGEPELIEDAAVAWWERELAYNPYHVKSGEHGGQFTSKEGEAGGDEDDDDEEKGPPVEKKISPKQAKADEAWKRAQELKPLEHEQAPEGQTTFPGMEPTPEEGQKRLEAEEKADDWSNQGNLDQWEPHDDEVEASLEAHGLPRDQQHPNESDEDYAARQARDEWRGYNDERPPESVQEDQGRAIYWEANEEGDYGSEYYDQVALDSWKDYDGQFTEGEQAPGESDDDFEDRQAREGYREHNKSSEEADNEAAAEAEAEAQEEYQEESRRLSVEETLGASGAANVEETRDLLNYDDTSHASMAKNKVMEEIGAMMASDAAVSDDQLRAFNTEAAFKRPYGEAVSPEATTERGQEAEIAADAIVKKWAATSGDHDSGAIAVQVTAQKVFNLEDAEMDHFGHGFGGGVTLASEHEAVLTSSVKSMYANTQETLKDGPEKLWLFRGVSEDYSDGDTVQLQPLSSFSTNPNISKEFAGGGTVFAVEVPRDRIFSTARTGAGCLNEEEIIVLGGEYVLRVLRW
jgi:hypothetical protein